MFNLPKVVINKPINFNKNFEVMSNRQEIEVRQDFYSKPSVKKSLVCNAIQGMKMLGY